MAEPAIRRVSPTEYLDLERASPIRHELVNGEAYGMAGASRWHSKLVTNLVVACHGRFEARGCSTSATDLRVRIPSTEAYLYPDVVVYCGEGKWLDEKLDTLEDPSVIFEVLSPSTEAFDRGAKFHYYSGIPSLQAYVLVSQDWVSVDCFARAENGWLMTSYIHPQAELKLPIEDVSIPLSEIYARVPAKIGPRSAPIDPREGRDQSGA